MHVTAVICENVKMSKSIIYYSKVYILSCKPLIVWNEELGDEDL